MAPHAGARTRNTLVRSYVDRVTLPADSDLAPAVPAFCELRGCPERRERLAPPASLGLNTDRDLERYLGSRVADTLPDS
jgi:hypothetical protein